MPLYTEYELTDHQCRVLSQIVHSRLRNFRGPTIEVLMRFDLVAKLYGDKYMATEKGVQALRDARQEGW